MTPAQIEAAGRILFGNDWRYPFCDKFLINTRTLRRFLAGTDPVPQGLAREIEVAIRDHANRADELLEAISQ